MNFISFRKNCSFIVIYGINTNYLINSKNVKIILNLSKIGDLGDIKENTRTTTKKKCNAVKFNTTLRIVLIPARSDYESSNLTDILWWTEGKSYNIDTN